MSAPGCLSGAFSVGATDKSDDVAGFSNSSAGLDILATGVDITSAGLGNGTAPNTGTSMAAPHVAGAVALLRQADSDLSPDQIAACLLDSPTAILDPASGFTNPLLDIPAALESCGFPLCNAATYEAEAMFHSTGGAATDGWNIWSNGFISTNHNFTAGPNAITVYARGESANGVAPHMVVSVGGTPIGHVFVPQTTYTRSRSLQRRFRNAGSPRHVRHDFYQPPADRTCSSTSSKSTAAKRQPLRGVLRKSPSDQLERQLPGSTARHWRELPGGHAAGRRRQLRQLCRRAPAPRQRGSHALQRKQLGFHPSGSQRRLLHSGDRGQSLLRLRDALVARASKPRR